MARDKMTPLFGMMKNLFQLAFVATFLGAVLQFTLSASAATIVAGTYGDWSLHINESASSKICFAAAEPKEKLPQGSNRATTAFYVSTWPRQGVKGEVSVKLGYPIKSQSDVTVLVGKDEFKLFSRDERAFVSDPTQELKLIETMKRGSNLVVKAQSERGTATTDTYSLAGFAQAMQELAKTCP
jgi:invasion protein IalB